ncbi:MAG: HAD-IIIA family hydrolase [bacterium]|nr:HAD-IIIA family hydrolase [bacterium]
MIWRAPPGPVPRDGPILFIDRDGVLIVDRDYLADPAGVELIPGVPAALRAAAAAGYALVGISNQSGVGRGRFGQAELTAVMERVDEALAEAGAGLDAMYYCPHAPQDDCRCRKPGPGLIEEASASFRWDVGRAWVIGDKASDVELGRRLGLGAVLVATGYGAGERALVAAARPGDERVRFAADLSAAVEVILSLAPDAGGGTP